MDPSTNSRYLSLLTIMRERVTTIVGVHLDSHSKKMAQKMEA